MAHALASSFGLRSIIMVSSTTVLFLGLCLSGALATYGSDYHHKGPHNLKVEDSKIHLDSPKIILDRPSINLLGDGHGHGHGHLLHGGLHGPLHEEEPIILSHDKPLYIRKSLHGIPAAYHHGAEGHVLVNEGYGTGSVISAPIQVIKHAPVVHDSPILIRRPVIVSSGGPLLATGHGHLSGGHLHYAGDHGHLGGGHLHYAGGHGHYAVPVSGALHEKTLVYGGHGHGLGHGLAYGGPVVVGPAYGAGHHGGLLLHSGSLSGNVLHGSEAAGHKKY